MTSKVHSNFIGGEWIPGPESSVNRSPSDVDDVIGEFARADAAQTVSAITAARIAQPEWSAMPIEQRHDLLDHIGTELIVQSPVIGRILAREEGKVLRDAVGEVARAGRLFKYYAGEVLRAAGEKLTSVRPGIEVEISREPLGVVGVITPWNFPIAIPAWKIAPALAYGNTVVFKPADLVPASAWHLVKVMVDAGLPPGVVNLVMGRGAIVGRAIVASSDVAAISFTGSIEVGRQIALEAAKRMAKVQLEMGGKNPLVIVDDADLDIAVDCAIQGGYGQTGQRCTASSRLVVTAGIHDRFVEALTRRLQTMRVGNALDPATDLGPVVDERQLEQDLMYISIGRAEGAQLVCGGQILDLIPKGNYLSPAVFVGATNEMRIAREEIFGPVTAVIRVHDYEEALWVANDTPFGLSAGIVTTSLSHASHFRRSSQSGLVMVNLPTAGIDYHAAFGGRKGSSYGPREQGTYAKEFYTTVKTAYVRP